MKGWEGWGQAWSICTIFIYMQGDIINSIREMLLVEPQCKHVLCTLSEWVQVRRINNRII